MEDGDVGAAIEREQAALEGRGRVLVRASGTEPLIRVMAEGEDEAMVKKIVEQLCAVIVKAAA